MRHVKWLIAVGLMAATTAACSDLHYPAYRGYFPSGYHNHYPSRYYHSGYPYQSPYYDLNYGGYG